MNKYILKPLILLVVICTTGAAFSQTIRISDGGTVNTCGGRFKDSGGNNDYGSGENHTITICPDIPGNRIEFTFSVFDIDPGDGVFEGADGLTIYDGDNTNAPSFGTLNNDWGLNAAGVLKATESNTSGCLTFVFTSTSGLFSEEAAGWDAVISCSPPCQDVVAQANASEAVVNNEILICQGTTIDFTGSGGYPENNQGYAQSDATTDFTWSISGEVQESFNSQNMSYTFDTSGVYIVDVQLVDVNGCTNANAYKQLVKVSTTPNFSATLPTSSECLGNTIDLVGSATPTEKYLQCTPPAGDTTFLPDGTGDSYESGLNVACFNTGDNISSSSDIVGVCIDMEHSYMGDLQIELVCPNGTSVVFLDYASNAGAGTFLGYPAASGLPIDDNTTFEDPGRPMTYCFAPSGTGRIDNSNNWTTLGSYTDDYGQTSSGTGVVQANPGTYGIEGNWNDFAGCPLNGDWTIKVTDNLSEDNGYIFNWQIEFDQNLVPQTSVADPQIASEGWQSHPTMTANNGTTATVEPTTAGQQCYIYEVTDTYGCDYDTTFCFDILDSNDPLCNNCNVTINNSVGTCDPGTGTYTVSGDVSFNNPPAAGTLTITETCSGQTEVVNAPFTSPAAYSFTNTADGSSCTITAVFSDDNTCTDTENFVAPGPCAPPVPCLMTYFDVARGPCVQATNTTEFTGRVEYQDPPTTGQLIVEDCQGNQAVFDCATLDPVGVDYTITGVQADGSAACTVRAYFTADPSCEQSQDLALPNDCSCPAYVGTFNTSINGQSNAANDPVIYLCYGDELTISSNGDYVYSTDVSADQPGIAYDPGILLGRHSCPPTVFGGPGLLSDDPCYLSLVGNDGTHNITNGTFTITNNLGDGSTAYYSPITQYSISDGYYSVTNSADQCFSVHNGFQIVFLPRPTISSIEDCPAGEVIATVGGSDPQYSGSDYTASNLAPGTASFTNTTATDGATITITGLIDGDTYSFDITDQYGCNTSLNGGPFTGPTDASFSFNPTTFCSTESPDPIPTITGDAGGAFSISGAGVINATTGEIDLDASGPGAFTVTYTSPGVCNDVQTLGITITPPPTADFSFGQYCLNDSDPAPLMGNGATGGAFSATGGLVINAATGIVDLDASTPGIYTVTNDVTSGTCALVSETATIEIFELPTAAISGSTSICSGEPFPDLTVDASGGISNWTVNYTTPSQTASSVVLSSNTGPLATGEYGSYTLTSVADGNGCTVQLNSAASISENPTPVFNPPGTQEYCEGDVTSLVDLNDPLYNVDGASLSWTSSTQVIGVGGSGTTDVQSFTSINGSQLPLRSTVTVTPTLNSCVGLPQSFDFVINPIPQVLFGGDDLQGCAPHTVNFIDSVSTSTASCSWDYGDGTFGTGCGSVGHTYNQPGCYDVTLTIEDLGCSNSLSYPEYVCVDAVPDAQFTANPQSLTQHLSGLVQFNNLSTNAGSYIWTYGNGYGSIEEDPSTTFDTENIDTFVVTLIAYNDSLTCWDTARRTIMVKDELIFYVPNAFTPNGDAYNNTFLPVMYSGFDPQDYTLYIFNRWGELIFESRNAAVGWDGTYRQNGELVQDGVYVWKIVVKKTLDEEVQNFYGHVTVLR